MTKSPLLSAAQLAQLCENKPETVVLDIRWSLAGGADREAYERGHIPTARFVDLESDLSAEPGAGGRHPLPDSHRAIETFRRLGINDASTVVCYDADNSTAAARAWWLLRYYGHSDSYVLDGGLAAWRRADQPMTVQNPTYGRGDFSAREPRVAVLVTSEVLTFAADHLLLDARDGQRYRGVVEPVDAVAGHIPKAVNAPTQHNVNTDGTFLSREELQQRFGQLGAKHDTPLATYCGSGVTAAHQILALETAGMSAALYPGSWSEWITDPERPVATGGDG